EILFVREVMRTGVLALPSEASIGQARAAVAAAGAGARGQRLFPAVDQRGALVGVVTRRDLDGAHGANPDSAPAGDAPLGGVTPAGTTARRPDEPLRVIVHRMAETGLTCLPVIEEKGGRHGHDSLLGLVTLKDMLKARVRHLEEERRRERVLSLGAVIPFGRV